MKSYPVILGWLKYTISSPLQLSVVVGCSENILHVQKNIFGRWNESTSKDVFLLTDVKNDSKSFHGKWNPYMCILKKTR